MNILEDTASQDLRQPFKKELLIGWIKHGKKSARVTCCVEFDANGRLSLTGEIGYNRNQILAVGQIDESLSDVTKFAKGWTKARVMTLQEIWYRWHLNDMNAACEHQRALGWTWDSHPSEPCPVCGYRLGHAWYFEEVPDAVLTFLKALN